MIRPRRASSAILILVLLTESLALADDTSKSGLAETLFQAAKKLMAEGKYAEACPKLAESQKLDPGGGTLLLLAQCHEEEGKLASAWAEYRDALAVAIKDGRADRANRCKERLAVVEPKLSHVTVKVAPAADVKGLTVSLDGVDLPRAAWSTPLPIDPGAHVVRAAAPERASFEKKLAITGIAASGVVTIEPLAVVESVASPPPKAVDTVAIDYGRPRRYAGYALIGAGVVAVGVGAFFGFRAIDKRKDSDAECPADRCTALGVDLNESAKTSANVANFAIGLGLVSAIVGGVLVLGAPKPEVRTARIAPAIGPTIGGVTFAMSF